MKYLLCLILFTCSFFYSEAQYSVVFKLGKYPDKHNNDTAFLAGSFNNWNPGNNAFRFLLTNENSFELILNLPAGQYAYKCTRGNWGTVECFADGKDINNHSFRITADTTIEINIEAWRDDFAPVTKMHTASKQVQVMDTAFFIPQLNRARRIWIYLPEGYEKNKKEYPVMYMHDGQNIFDEYTAGFGEWGVDECLDSLINAGKQACIVVGIDNGPKRLNEYNPFTFRNFGEAEGDRYLDFIVQTLKPFIDKKYRTLSSKENTIIAGSSMGGLLSYYAMIKQPQVFGKAGIFSPAFWTAPAINSLTDSLAAKVNGKFFFYIGGQEGAAYLNDMVTIQELLGEKSTAMIYSVIDAEGMHNEKAWRKWFAEFYNWIMAEGFNKVMKVDE
ncbi:MAG: alpha/beta hydrolase [Chitinophagaceae bacterium]|nr:alpha/beta hydrolase [Chitinophagaceae bacterium]